MKSLAAQDDDSKPGRGCKRGAASASQDNKASQDDKAGQEAKPKRGRRKEPAANTSMGVGEEPWAETNAADTTLETKDEQNNPPKRGRRRRPPQGTILFFDPGCLILMGKFRILQLDFDGSSP